MHLGAWGGMERPSWDRAARHSVHFSSGQTVVSDRARRGRGLGVRVKPVVIGCVVHRIGSGGMRDGAWFGVERQWWCVVG